MKTKLLFLLLTISIAVQGQVTSVAVVGSGAGGWPGDPSNPGPVDVHQMTSSDGENWVLNDLPTINGEVKFRANNAWDINWGDAAFPSGTGTQGGPNVPVVSGFWNVTFNSTTGAYIFSFTGPSAVVNLVGTAVGNPGGLVLNTVDAVNFTLFNIDLLSGNAQFNINGVPSGGDTFPNGIVSGNAINIPVVYGHYISVSFNIETGAYSFTPTAVYPLISITGSGVGGSGNGFDHDMTTVDGIHYMYSSLATIEGGLKFRTDHSWASSYGSTAFPSGTATINGDSIPITFGNWNVTFNLITGEYTFEGLSTSTTIAVVGSGAGGWPIGAAGEIDTNQLTTTDGITYTIYDIAITDGEVKFRQDNDWTINWGNMDFPSGVGNQNGNNIITTAGNYTITFNRITGEYNFGAPLRIAIVGSAAGGWPTGAVGEVDANRLTSTDGIHFRLNNITLTDGEAKFRQDNSWDVSWGGTSLFGTLVPDGPNIPVTAGTYSIAVDLVTGGYTFLEPLSVIEQHTPDFKVYPNPTQNNWNFSSAKGSIQSVQIIDMLGKTILSLTPAQANTTVDASSLNAGIYFAKIATATATETVKLVKN